MSNSPNKPWLRAILVHEGRGLDEFLNQPSLSQENLGTIFAFLLWADSSFMRERRNEWLTEEDSIELRTLLLERLNVVLPSFTQSSGLSIVALYQKILLVEKKAKDSWALVQTKSAAAEEYLFGVTRIEHLSQLRCHTRLNNFGTLSADVH